MKVIVTGKGGQLASEFELLKGSDVNWIFLSEKDLNITDKKAVQGFFTNKKFDYIINCAAYTAVDKAEDDIQLAYDVNEKGLENLIEACKKTNARIIHFSTDYVFNGESSTPYLENDSANPKSVYGQSKLAGENVLKRHESVESLIIRTSWVYSNFGQNFVKTMLSLGKQKSELGIVADQIGSPTFAHDLAMATLKIFQNENYQWKNGDIFHYSNEGRCSWCEFAKYIFDLAHLKVKVNSLSTDQFPTRAVRPKFSLLNKTKFKETFNVEINHWKDSLEKMLKSEL